ncbi:hypothetical protein ACOD71_003245 [Escherichia coli]|uniref:hypothetical protein n=1 Tax=Escherichia TaxID=561 RepID=UPI00076F5806|nr:hypothetical protein [Escherichia coli]AWT03648.1 hypothetical protein BEN53_22470 [Escherichia coli]AZR86986.1 hypothetical protein DWB25_00565 [Escherichia coli]EFO4256518.1 hypothetical protein [Escherichia coli]EFR5139014.1 hypothetical protein [Escherichia coli]EHK7309680.1 hypothetical protein [Escherichia coli]
MLTLVTGVLYARTVDVNIKILFTTYIKQLPKISWFRAKLKPKKRPHKDNFSSMMIDIRVCDQMHEA